MPTPIPFPANADGTNTTAAAITPVTAAKDVLNLMPCLLPVRCSRALGSPPRPAAARWHGARTAVDQRHLLAYVLQRIGMRLDNARAVGADTAVSVPAGGASAPLSPCPSAARPASARGCT